MSSTSIRLFNQYYYLGAKKSSHQKHIGIIHPNCDVVEVLKDGYGNARHFYDLYYDKFPELELQEIKAKSPDLPVQVVYGPSYLFR